MVNLQLGIDWHRRLASTLRSNTNRRVRGRGAVVSFCNSFIFLELLDYVISTIKNVQHEAKRGVIDAWQRYHSSSSSRSDSNTPPHWRREQEKVSRHRSDDDRDRCDGQCLTLIYVVVSLFSFLFCGVFLQYPAFNVCRTSIVRVPWSKPVLLYLYRWVRGDELSDEDDDRHRRGGNERRRHQRHSSDAENCSGQRYRFGII